MAKQSKIDAERIRKEEHRARLAASKAGRREQVDLERPAPTKNEKPLILIYCEGQNTEPSYFNKFKISSMTVEAFGEGRNTLSLVKHVKTLIKKAKGAGKAYEEIWCVFDADPKPDNPQQLKNFNDAVKLSRELNYGTAYSNQAFEYWLILHFEDHQGGAMPRTDYDGKLNGYLTPLKLSYDGGGAKEVSQGFFDHLFKVIGKDKQGNPVTLTTTAIRRAENVYDFHEPHTDPGREESSTTVHLLVKRLLEIQADEAAVD